MKSDINALMAKRKLEAILIVGGEGFSDVRVYMSNGADITGGYIVQKQGGTPLVVVNGMEIAEAQKSGYPCLTYGDVGFYDLMKEHGLNHAQVLMWGVVLKRAGVHHGRVGVYGEGSINTYIELASLAGKAYPEYEFVGEYGSPTLFQEAYLTKDSAELARIQSVAQRTNAVVAKTWDFIAGHHADANETVVKADGTPLTIGDVKRFVRRELLDVELEEASMIFAQGRDGAFPHSRGEAHDALKLGQPIVFDLFPRELGGGYFHDMTRTWCIGYAPPAVQELYDTVMEAFDIAIETFAVGKRTHTMQEAVLDYFEGKGHPTVRTSSNPTEGYVHSLGHGVGLNIHEAPSIHHLRKEDVFQVGNFITIEPGLYYPERNMGVRVEDSFIVTEAGELVSITPFKKDLVLPLKG